MKIQSVQKIIKSCKLQLNRRLCSTYPVQYVQECQFHRWNWKLKMVTKFQKFTLLENFETDESGVSQMILSIFCAHISPQSSIWGNVSHGHTVYATKFHSACVCLNGYMNLNIFGGLNCGEFFMNEVFLQNNRNRIPWTQSSRSFDEMEEQYEQYELKIIIKTGKGWQSVDCS